MSLRFPRIPDVRLANSPLAEVICQVRFPTILRIAKQSPSDFQELVRHRFPLLEASQNIQFAVAGVASDAAAEAVVAARHFRFVSADKQTIALLSPDSFSLTQHHYTVWDEFARDLQLIHDAVQQIYKLPFATRIGLRYVNVFSDQNTGFSSLDALGQVLRPELTCLLTSEAWSQPEEMLTQILLTDDPGRLTIRVGARAHDEELGPSLLLDLDYFEEGDQVPIEGLLDRCRNYHDTVYNAFRWALNGDQFEIFERVRGGAV
jgi:uncharacterized protein (TIGR04255 family)